MKIDAQEGHLRAHLFCMVWCEEEKYEENLVTFRYLILRNYWGDFFQFGMQGCVYGLTKIYKFDRNQSNSFRAMID